MPDLTYGKTRARLVLVIAPNISISLISCTSSISNVDIPGINIFPSLFNFLVNYNVLNMILSGSKLITSVPLKSLI